LGGNQVSKRMVYRNLIFVFLLSGLWHGASWNFVIWGAWHGIFLILERVFLNNILKKLPSILTVSYTYFVVLIGWVFFRTEQFSEAIVFIKNMFGIKNPIVEMEAIPSEFYVFLAIGLVFAFITMTSFGKKLEQFLFYSTYSNKQHVYLSISSVAVFAISIGYIAASGFNPFIYFRF